MLSYACQSATRCVSGAHASLPPLSRRSRSLRAPCTLNTQERIITFLLRIFKALLLLFGVFYLLFTDRHVGTRCMFSRCNTPMILLQVIQYCIRNTFGFISLFRGKYKKNLECDMFRFQMKYVIVILAYLLKAKIFYIFY